ncbi:MAG: Acetyltransferase family protein [Gemmatimonadetes bacterium]|nr:Acetyltransferase family protein [Gemmatimonadota bacterium]
MPPAIRPATEADVPRMIEVARRSFLSAFGFTAPFPLIQQWIREDRESTAYPASWADMFVLERDGVIAGLMQPTLDEIDGLWIHPDYQDQGIGSSLLRHGEDVVRSRGFSRSWLTCSSFNPRALEFYRRRGYTVFRSTRTLHECGVDEESFGMERLLGGAA